MPKLPSSRTTTGDALSRMSLDCPRPWALRGAERHVVRCAGGHEHVVDLWIPQMPIDGAVRTIVTLDGRATFATMVDALHLQSGRSRVTGIAPAIVVGLSHPSEGLFDQARRRRDLTPWPSLQNGPAGAPCGGADAYLDFLCGDLLPAAEARAGFASGVRALFGHSLGGLFALHTLFTRPDAFRSIAAASPSLWWNRVALAEEEAAFARCGPHLPTRLIVTVGTDEMRPDAVGGPMRHTAEEAEMLTDRLARLNLERLAVDFTTFPGENHGSVLPAAISRALRVLSPMPGGERG